MNRVLAVLTISTAVPALATTYTVPAGSSAKAIQAIVNTAGAVSGNTVVFSAGSYNLTSTVDLPCTNGTVYSGPNVGPLVISYSRTGAMSLSNLPTAVFSVSNNNYVFSVNNNGPSYTSPTAGCTIQYMAFSGTQGGIYVNYPSSGITVQNNAFYNNNPPWNDALPSSNSAIYLDGENGAGSASGGVSYISILWNSFFNNCSSIQANAWPDAGGDCNAVHVQSYNNYVVIKNNVVNQTEEGFKFYEQPYEYPVQFNVDVENNNMQGNSRILIEDQQPTNANAIFSHNAFYQPTNPSYNTFELSMPLNQCVNSAAGCSGNGSGVATASNDDVYIGNVPVTITGSGAHYGIGLEQWGVGATATYSLFQGGNGPDTCDAGYGCSGWGIVVGLPFSNVNDGNNYFSGYDVAAYGPFGYEAGATESNAGMLLNQNTVVSTSSTIPTVAPAISAASGSQGFTITLSDSDTNHGLSIFYTTDGSNPAIFTPGRSAGTSQVYQGPFTVAAGTTVRAIASWGQGANQGIVFPSFGYVPSSVTALTVTPSSPTLVGAYLRANGNSMSAGTTMQFTAYGTYSDGSVGKLPDAYGNKVTLWNTTNHAVAKVSSLGHVTAYTRGQVNVEATVGSVKATPWTMTIAPALPAASSAPASAAAQTSPMQAELAGSSNGIAADGASSSSAAPTPVSPDGVGADASPGSSSPSAGNEAPAAPAIPAAAASTGIGSIAMGPVPAPPGPALADAFLGPFWKLANPVGGSASISDGHLFIGVPGGSNHDALTPSNQAVRVVQTVGNSDFDVAIKIDSPVVPSDTGTSQGLMLMAGNADYITFALTTDGTRVGLKANTVVNGAVSTVLQDTDFTEYQTPMYLRMARSGSAYIAYYSVDGMNWTQAASFTYSQVPTAIGPFAGNYSQAPEQAVPVVMAVNWFDVQE
jgi:Chitobiase/beta-hexosaminidase C-terminal domain/Bacterial Ig-like domain (group 2)/Beta xylosidase C-terminal Concanavalin A-like domain